MDRRGLLGSIGMLALGSSALAAEETKPIRVGILGMDNYVCVEFAQFFNDPKATVDLAGLRVVCGYPHTPSPDIAGSAKNLEMWIEQIRPKGVAIVDSPKDVLKQVDCVMVMTQDGRNHPELVRMALNAGKPTFVGRPLAASLGDAVKLFKVAEEKKTPLFSCSQHRYSSGFYDMRNHPEVGKIMGVDVHGGCPMDPSHRDLFWHGIHGIETLYTLMGPGCVSVQRASTDSTELVTGVWKDGRVGTYRGIRAGAIQYKALVYGDKGVVMSGKYGGHAPIKGVEPEGEYTGYKPLAIEIGKFYKTRVSPVPPSETIELFAFMEAALLSKQRAGAVVSIQSVLDTVKV